MVQSFNSTLTLTLQGLGDIKKGFEALAKLDMQEVAEKAATGAAQKMSHEVIKTLSPKIENSAKDTLNRGALKSPGISLNDASAINSRFTRFAILHLVTVTILCFTLWLAFELRDERDELMKIECLYRLRRVISSDAENAESEGDI